MDSLAAAFRPMGRPPSLIHPPFPKKLRKPSNQFIWIHCSPLAIIYWTHYHIVFHRKPSVDGKIFSSSSLAGIQPVIAAVRLKSSAFVQIRIVSHVWINDFKLSSFGESAEETPFCSQERRWALWNPRASSEQPAGEAHYSNDRSSMSGCCCSVFSSRAGSILWLTNIEAIPESN